MTLEIVRIDAPDESLEDAILAPLIAYNDQAHGPSDYVPLAIVVREPGSQTVLGGLWGGCFFDWCVVRLLVVPEQARGQGLGRRLMAQAESFAIERGCEGIWLDTFSFQARGFYEKLGFSIFGTLDGHPRGGSRIFLQKRLAPRGSDDAAR